MATTITTSQTASTLPQKKGDPPNFGTVKSGRALAFDGVVDSLRLANTSGNYFSSLDLRYGTIAVWVKAASVANADRIFSHYSSDPERRFYLGFGINNRIYWRMSGGGDEYTPNDSITLDTWHRVVMTWGNSNVNIYIDGALSDTSSDDTSDFNTNLDGVHWSIGSHDGANNYFDGNMSDFQLWDSKWTLTDVQNDYRHPEMLAHTFSGTSLTESNLKVWYPMTEGNPESPQTTIFDGSPKVLGSELITNFTNWTDPADVTVTTNASTNTVTLEADDDSCNSLTYLSASGILAGNLPVGVYKITFTASWTSAPSVKRIKWYYDGSNFNELTITEGLNTFYQTTSTANGNSHFGIEFNDADQDITLSNVSIKKVQRGNHATSVFYGDDLVTNGTFASDSNWNKNSMWSISGGVAVSDGTGSGDINQSNVLTVGKTYEISFDIVSLTSGDGYSVRAGSGTAYSSTFNSVATHTVTQVCLGNGYLYINADGSATGSIDNVTVKEVGLSTTGHVEGQETIFQPAFAGQSRKKVFGDTATYAEITTDIEDINDGKSISLWFNPQNEIPTSSAGDYGVLIGSNNTNSNIHINSATQIQMRDDTSGVEFTWTVPTMSVGNWYHLAVVFDDDRYYTLYLNGSFISTQDNDAFSGLNVDRIGGSSGGAEFQFDGIIDEISYWTKELTLADVQEMYNDGVPLDLLTHSSTSDLVHYWRNNNLDSNGKWKDLKGSNVITFWKTNDYEAIFPEGITSGRDINGFFLTHPNKNYLSCDANTYIDVPHSNVFDFGTGDFSLECWAKLSDTNSAVNGAGLVIKQENYNANVSGYGLYWRQDDKTVIFNVGDGTDGIRIVSSALNLNQWYHIVGTYNGTTGAGILYIDKSSAGTATDSTIDSTDTSLDVEIGRETTKYHNGFVDDVRIYGKVLSTSEIAKNYRHGSGKHKD